MVQLVNAELVEIIKPFFVTRREWYNQVQSFSSGDITAVTAGAGLTGGGTSGDVTLDVVAATNSGLTVNADDITITLQTNPGLALGATGLTVDLDTNPGLLLNPGGLAIGLQSPSGLDLAAGGLAVADSLAGSGLNISSKVMSVDWTAFDGSGITGDGLTWDAGNTEIDLGTPGTLTVSTSNAVTASSHTHAITSSSDPGQAASLLASDGTGKLTLYQLQVEAGGFIVWEDASNYGFITVDTTDLQMGAVGTNLLFTSDTGNISLSPTVGWTQVTDGNFGIGVVPANTLQVRDTSSPQFKLDYNASNYLTVGVVSDGHTTFTAAGTDADMTFVSGADIFLDPDGGIVYTLGSYISVNPATATAPFVLSGNAQGQKVIGLRADQLAKDVIAGTGLTGGGTLTGDVTLNVDLTDGTFDALAGDGLTWDAVNDEIDLGTPSTLDVLSLNNVTATSHTHTIDHSFSPSAGEGNEKILSSDDNAAIWMQRVGIGDLYPQVAGGLHIATTGARQARIGYDNLNYADFIVDASGNFEIESIGDINLTPSGGDVVVTGGLGIGTTSSAGRLTVRGTGGAQLRLEYDVNTWMQYEIQSSGINYLSTSSSDDLRIQPGGNLMLNPTGANVTVVGQLGVGPTPAYALQVRDTATPQVSVEYDVSNYGRFSISSSGTMTVDTTQNINLNPLGNQVDPSNNYDINLGALTKKYLSLHAAELVVETLVAADTIGTIGGRVLVGPTTILESDLTTTVISGSEEVTNGGFTVWTGNIPSSWNSVLGATLKGDDHQSGWGVRLRPGSAPVRGYLYQDIALTNGSYYTLTFYVRREYDGVGYPQYDIYDNGNSTQLVGPTDITTPVGVWTKVTSGFRAETGHTTIRIRFWSPPMFDRDSQSAYIEGGFSTPVSNAPAYIDGTDPGTSSKAAYIEGGPASSKSAYVDVDERYYVTIDTVSLKETNNIIVRHNEMDIGDIAYMEANGNVEFFEIVSGPISTSGSWAYVVLRNIDASGANTWTSGDAVFNTGKTGDGFIDMYSFQQIAGTGYGPTIAGNIRNSTTYNDWDEHWAIGRLDGIYGQTGDINGVGLGRYATGYQHLLLTDTDGIEFWDGDETTGKLIGSWDGTRVQIGAVSESHVIISASDGIQLKNGSVVKGEWQADGDIFIGSDTGAPNTTYFSGFATSQSYNGEAMNAGDILIGDNSGIVSILSDGGFELWRTSTDPQEWGVSSEGTVSRSTTKHSGQYSVELDGNNDDVHVWQQMTVLPSTYYTLTGWHRPGGYRGTYRVYDVTNGSWLFALQNAPATGGSSWYQFTYTFQTASNTTEIRLYLYGPSLPQQLNCFFDDVSVVEGPYLNTLFDRDGGAFKIRKGDTDILEIDRSGNLSWGMHFTEANPIVEFTQSGLEIDLASTGDGSLEPGLYIKHTNYPVYLFGTDYFYSTNGLTQSEISLLHRPGSGSANYSYIQMGYDEALSNPNYININAGTSSNGGIHLGAKTVTTDDPVVAAHEFYDFLECQVGIRWIGGAYNANRHGTSYLYSINAQNMTSGNSKRDTTNWYSYTVLDDTVPSYFHKTDLATWFVTSSFSGAETQGLTMGGWFYFDHLGTSQDMGLISSWDASTTNGSWRVHTWYTHATQNTLAFGVSNTGSYIASQTVVLSQAPPTGQWVFVCARWKPSTEIKLWMKTASNEYSATNTTSILSSLKASPHFLIGATKSSGGTIYAMDGRVGYTWFSAGAASDSEIEKMWSLSRAIYGV